MLDFLLFRKMLMPFIIQLFFWFVVIACIVGAIHNFMNHAVWHGLQILILGPLIVRVVCEFLMLFFNMNQTLTDLKNTVKEKH